MLTHLPSVIVQAKEALSEYIFLVLLSFFFLFCAELDTKARL